MKYKVGDKVMARRDLEVGERYGDDIFTGEMEKYKGKIAKIAKETCVGYELEDFMYNWTFEMLRPAEFKIWCETEEEKQAVLEELEKEGYVWCCGDKPTNGKNTHAAPVMLYVENEVIRQNWTKKPFDFTPSEFTGINFSEKIIIAKTLTGATATYGDKTVTTEGDFEDASRQALAEVLCPYRVGDRVIDKRCKRDGVVTNVRNVCEVLVHFKDGEDDMAFKTLEFLEPYTEPLYNAKLFCIKGSDRFKAGYVYEVKNGMFNDTSTVFNDLNDINDFCSAQFMEVKGGLDE